MVKRSLLLKKPVGRRPNRGVLAVGFNEAQKQKNRLVFKSVYNYAMVYLMVCFSFLQQVFDQYPACY